MKVFCQINRFCVCSSCFLAGHCRRRRSSLRLSKGVFCKSRMPAPPCPAACPPSPAEPHVPMSTSKLLSPRKAPAGKEEDVCMCALGAAAPPPPPPRTQTLRHHPYTLKVVDGPYAAAAALRPYPNKVLYPFRTTTLHVTANVRSPCISKHGFSMRDPVVIVGKLA